jgi:hypothetical protein
MTRDTVTKSTNMESEFWVYENTVHRKARIHRADCSFCSDGRGLHGGGESLSGKWFGPFTDFESASTAARNTRQDDVRDCGACLGSQASAKLQQPVAPASPGEPLESGPWDWDRREEVACALRLNWVPRGRVTLDARSKVEFPDAPATGGLYRFKTRYPDGRFAIYIGESDNLKRRFSNYRNPGPTQRTSVRINAWLLELLSSGGEISVAIVEDARLTTKVGEATADFSVKSVRRLFEQLAISLEHASEIESLNR